MAASEMGFSCSAPPWYPTETPHALRRATRARRKASACTSGRSQSMSAFCHLLGGHHLMSGPSTPTTCAPTVSGVTGWVLAARRASPNVGACTSGRSESMSAVCHLLGGHRDDGRPQHAHHARAERARRDWVALGAT